MGARKGDEAAGALRSTAVTVAILSGLTLLAACGGDSTVAPALPEPPKPPIVKREAALPEAPDNSVREDSPTLEVRITTRDGTPLERVHLHDVFVIWEGWTDSTGTARMPANFSTTLQVAAEGFAPLLDTGRIEDGEVLVLEPCRWVELVLDDGIELPTPPEFLAVYLVEAHRTGTRDVSTAGVDYRGAPLVDLAFSPGEDRRVRLAIPTSREVWVEWGVTRRDDRGGMKYGSPMRALEAWLPPAPQDSVVMAPPPEIIEVALEQMRHR